MTHEKHMEYKSESRYIKQGTNVGLNVMDGLLIDLTSATIALFFNVYSIFQNKFDPNPSINDIKIFSKIWLFMTQQSIDS